jgi:hypothetical protein
MTTRVTKEKFFQQEFDPLGDSFIEEDDPLNRGTEVDTIFPVTTIEEKSGE